MSCFAQKSEKTVASIIEGHWIIEHRLPAVSIDNPGVSTDKKVELLDPTSKEISFADGNFSIIPNGKTGKYQLKKYSIILNDKQYKCAYITDDKFSLIRIISPDLLLLYMLERKRKNPNCASH